jgi:hypothetical protein
MKTRSWLLTLVAAISGLAMLAIPAQAGGKKKYYYRDGWHRDTYGSYSRDWDNRRYRHYQPYYRRGYDYPPPYYRPIYRRAPGFVIQFGFE